MHISVINIKKNLNNMFEKDTLIAIGVVGFLLLLATTPRASSQTAGTTTEATSVDLKTQVIEAERQARVLQKELEEIAKPQVLISSVNPADTRKDSDGDPYEDEDDEYVILKVKKSVNLTGWKLKSQRTGNSVTIGKVNPIANSVLEKQDLIANPGDRIIVVSGRSPIRESFRMNSCSDSLDIFEENPRIPFGYADCVKENEHKDNFFEDEWQVYGNEKDSVWKRTRDTINLVNLDGKVVDTYSYK